MPDFVNQTDPTDQGADSTGCGMAFLSWLMSQGFTLGRIAQAMVSLGDSGTLAQLYNALTGQPAANAWPAFQAAVQALPDGVSSDDPFNAGPQPPQLAQLGRLDPATVALAGKVFAAILADLAAGKPAHHVAASVATAMAPAPPAARPMACGTRSRRLLPPDRH
jgi:hypothetical protein